jgi:hypothetical protein
MKLTNTAFINFIPTIIDSDRTVTNNKKDIAIDSKSSPKNSNDTAYLQPLDTAFIAYQMMGLG